MVKDLERIASRFNLSLIILFGSYAKGKIRIGSDRDIAVWINAKRMNELRLFYEFINLYKGENIDLLILNTADPLTQYEVAANGKLLYEKAEGGFRRFQVFAMKRNDDGRKFSELDKIYVDRYLKGEYTYERPSCNPPKIRKDGRISWRTGAYNKG